MTLPNIKAYNIATKIKTLWCWWRDRYRDQQNRIENSETDPCKYTQLIFDKFAKTSQWREKGQSFQQIVSTGAIGHPQVKKKKEPLPKS